MMKSNTSVNTYKKITQNGLLSEQREAVYRTLYKRKAATASQLAEVMGERVKGSVCARLTELRDRGVVKEKAHVKCPVSGEVVALWTVTGKLPKKPVKRVSASRKRIQELEAKLLEMEGEFILFAEEAYGKLQAAKTKNKNLRKSLKMARANSL